MKYIVMIVLLVILSIYNAVFAQPYYPKTDNEVLEQLPARGESWFEIMLVPHTLLQTAFGQVPIGTPVNLEVDLVARYVERLMTAPRE